MGDPAGILRVPHSDRAGTGLVAWEAMDPDSLVSGTPVQRGWLADEDAAAGYLVGVWDCTAFTDRPGPYPVDEFMLLLEGSVTLRLPDGGAVTVGPGEAFVIPKGFECQWVQPGYVRKVFMIVDDPLPEGADNPSLGRIARPGLGPDGGGGEAAQATLETARTAFENACARMSVSVIAHAGGRSGPRPATAHHLFHVLEGALSLEADGDAVRLGPGESGYLRAGTHHTRSLAPGTRLIEARYQP